MAAIQEILDSYNHLLALDDDDDAEKQWLAEQDQQASGLRTSHFHILAYLNTHPQTTAKQICQNFGVLRGTLSKRMAVLVKRGLVSQQADQSDARSKNYTLTATGKRLVQLHAELLNQKNGQLVTTLQTFDDQELATIARFLRQLTQAEENLRYN